MTPVVDFFFLFNSVVLCLFHVRFYPSVTFALYFSYSAPRPGLLSW